MHFEPRKEINKPLEEFKVDQLSEIEKVEDMVRFETRIKSNKVDPFRR